MTSVVPIVMNTMSMGVQYFLPSMVVRSLSPSYSFVIWENRRMRRISPFSWNSSSSSSPIATLTAV